MEQVDVAYRQERGDVVMAGRRDQTKKLLRGLHKIEIFDGLSVEQARKILSICEAREYSAGEVLCKQDTPSTEMFILLSGALEIRWEEGARVEGAEPGECVGEMGVLTGHPRSATVVASEGSVVFVVRESDLKRVIAREYDVGIVVLGNVAKVLSRRLRVSNILVMSASDPA